MKVKQKIIAIVLTVFSVGLINVATSPSAYAASCTSDDGTKYETSILPCGGPMDLIKFGVNLLSAGIAIAGVGGIIFASIMYMTAGGSTDQTKQAKRIIFNVVIGMIAYALGYAFLNFIIPGGLVTP